MVAHNAGRRVNGGFKNLWTLCIIREIANYHQSRTFPNPMCRIDQPLIDHVSEAVPVLNPQSCLSVFPLVHGSRRPPDQTVYYIRGFEEREAHPRQIVIFLAPESRAPLSDRRLSFRSSKTSLSLGDLPQPAWARACAWHRSNCRRSGT